MKFTNKDLAKAMRLKVGDKVKFKNGEIAKVTEDYELDFCPIKAKLEILVNVEYKILPRKKKVGDKLCANIPCKKCPIFIGCKFSDCPAAESDTLFYKLEKPTKYIMIKKSIKF